MKKFFTTILLMGVALTGWAKVTAECPPGQGPKTLTITYEEDPNNPWEMQNLNIDELLKPHMKEATTVKLVGDWANGHISKIGNIVEKMNNNVVLDLSECEKMVSKIEYTGEGDADWTSTNFKYVPDGSDWTNPQFKFTGYFNQESKVKGLIFPNNKNFTAIPEEL